ncbi:MAG: hypothetical protein JSW55_09210 [Chloroflexota bacterium]|nr:MAG: hypothetical protein JSW55_09210 [Chloroflexota bacterium]
MAVSRTALKLIVFVLMLGMPAAVGCQAQTNDLPVAEPTAVDQETAPVVPRDDEPEAESTPTATTAAAPTATGDVQTRPVEAATEENDMDDEETPTQAPEETVASAGANADVEFVRAVQDAGGSWTFHVTVRHPDTGWEDYADGWDVVTPDGQVLKAGVDDPFTRLLLHPHENEQPFTRSQRGIVVPDGVTMVTVRAHDLVDGFGGREVSVDLTADSGPGYEIERQ